MGIFFSKRAIFEWMKKMLSNKYIITLMIFGVWMIFFDQNSFVAQRKFTKELNQLEARKKAYAHQNELLKVQSDNLLGSFDNLEKLAREKYLMKRDDEDLYLVEVEN
jgi:cell division protein FtsB